MAEPLPEISPAGEMEADALPIAIGAEDVGTAPVIDTTAPPVPAPRGLDDTIESWGRTTRASHRLHFMEWKQSGIPSLLPEEPGMLPYGLGRSYGDSCLNEAGLLLMTRRLDRFVAFDAENGILRCEAGVTFDEILRLIVPAGWFLPVTPGTRHVTVGGAIANDVHGKNHHREGTFGVHVTRFELLRSNGQRLECAPEAPGEAGELFAATVGGLGLTGLIVWAEFRLKKIHNPYMDTESIRFGGLDEFFDLSAASDATHEYSVAWVDCLKDGKHTARGLFNRGNHSPIVAGEARRELDRRWKRAEAGSRITVPVDAPELLINPLSMRIFNALYYRKQLKRHLSVRSHYGPFFYPLDGVGQWNRLYGFRGLYQHQLVVPYKESREAIRAVFKEIVRSAFGSCLAVLKVFGDRPSPGMMSFPRPGVTLALDFANIGPQVLRLMRNLDAIVVEAGGAIYPAKDARMSPETFRASFPRLEEFEKHVDPAFSSTFWRRVMEREEEGLDG